jgi:hypothetical protein
MGQKIQTIQKKSNTTIFHLYSVATDTRWFCEENQKGVKERRCFDDFLLTTDCPAEKVLGGNKTACAPECRPNTSVLTVDLNNSFYALGQVECCKWS